MEERLSRIFKIKNAGLLFELCEAAMHPISMVGTLYDDAKPVLSEFKKYGL